MLVTIRKEHTTNSSYFSPFCPLYQAIREQYPKLEIQSVGINMIHTVYHGSFSFRYEDWNVGHWSDLCEGKTEEVRLEIGIPEILYT